MKIDEDLAGDYSLPFPTVRLFTWVESTISLGRNQNPEKRLTLELCKRDGLSVVVRPTGGKELLHGHDLCYSVIWPLDRFGEAIDSRRLMGEINETLVGVMARFGIKARWRRGLNRRGVSKGPCFAQVDRGEIMVDGKKLIASAQRIYDRAILQQGSMPLGQPRINLADYLKGIDRESMSRQLKSGSAAFFELVDETFSVGSIVDAFKEEFELAFEAGTRLIER